MFTFHQYDSPRRSHFFIRTELFKETRHCPYHFVTDTLRSSRSFFVSISICYRNLSQSSNIFSVRICPFFFYSHTVFRKHLTEQGYGSIVHYLPVNCLASISCTVFMKMYVENILNSSIVILY